MMDYSAYMKQTADIVTDRQARLGDPQKFYSRVVQLYALITGVQLTNREAVLFMHAVKLARVFEDPENADHYMDGVNYLAFAGVANSNDQSDAKKNVPQSTYTPTPLKPLNLSERAVASAIGGGSKEIGG